MFSAQLPSSQLQVARSNKKPAWQTAPTRISICIEFNLSTGNYGDLIQQLRDTLQQPGRYSHNLPVMQDRPRGIVSDYWIDLVLSSSSRTITLRIRQDNLYIVGYQMPDGGQWLEFGRQGDPQQIPGSTFLGFSGNYDDLQRVGRRPLVGTQIGRAQVLNAIDELSRTSDRELKARDLCLLILVICEGTRFQELSGRFARVMHTPTSVDVTIEPWMHDLITSWGELSGRLIEADTDGDQYFRLPTNSPLRERIPNALAAASCLGLLLGSVIYTSPRRDKYVAARCVADVAAGRQPMMEVFSIQSGDAPGVFSCTIRVRDGLGPQTLFSGQVSLGPGDPFPLKPLERAISAWESVTIEMGGYPDDDGGGCAQRLFSWDIFQSNNPYATTGTDTAAAYNMAINQRIFPEAWQVIWVVKIESSDGYDPMNVYGSLKASYWYQGSRHEIPLFSRSSDNNALVSAGGNLPLLRYATALPYDVDLTVDGNLWDHFRLLSDRCLAYGQRKCHLGDGGTGRPNGIYKIPFDLGDASSQVTAYLYWYHLSQTAY